MSLKGHNILWIEIYFFLLFRDRGFFSGRTTKDLTPPPNGLVVHATFFFFFF